MTDAHFALSTDMDLDDLPRTLRREHEARAREARRRDVTGPPEAYASHEGPYISARSDYAPPSTVTAIDVPFIRLSLFLVKAVLAAIPALILLTAILWLGGQALQLYFPELLKMKILITFPNG